jgi:hypothetical protein
MAGTLEMIQGEGRGIENPVWRHSLDGRNVEQGELLSVLLADGLQLIGRYGWSGIPGRSPTLTVVLDQRIQADLVLPLGAVVARAEEGVA